MENKERQDVYDRYEKYVNGTKPNKTILFPKVEEKNNDFAFKFSEMLVPNKKNSGGRGVKDNI